MEALSLRASLLALITAAVGLALWLFTRQPIVLLCAKASMWVFVLLRVLDWVREKRMRMAVGVVLLLVGFGYAAQAIAHSGGGEREGASWSAAIIASVTCVGIGIAFVYSSLGAKRNRSR